MRKFTKEISVLLDSTTIEATLGARAVFTSSEQSCQTEASTAESDKYVEATQCLAGSLMAVPTEDVIEPAAKEELSQTVTEPLMSDQAPVKPLQLVYADDECFNITPTDKAEKYLGSSLS